MVDLSAKIAGCTLPICVLNASGPKDTTLQELEAIANSHAGGIVSKSCTIEARDGNEEPRYIDLPLGSINSMGLPNHGYRATMDYVKTLRSQTQKPIIVSIAGLKPSDFPIMVEAMQEVAPDLLEVNLSCPNVPGKPQIAYDFEMMEQILAACSGLGSVPLGIKLPPYFDHVHFEQAAAIVSRHAIACITCINSIGNALVIDPETETAIIKPKGGFGGLGGAYIKPTGLANVRAFRQLLGEEIGIMGAGGVYTGTDAFEYLLAGADAVQVGTCFMQQGPDCFGRIATELQDLLERKGYPSARAARGALRIISN